MARSAITPTTFINNRLYGISWTTLNSSQEGWYVDVSDLQNVILLAYSTHTSAVPITVCAGTSEMSTSYQGQDFIYKAKGDLSTSIGSSAVSILFMDSARFKSTSGFYIDCATSGSTAIQWAAYYNKPTL